MRVPIALAALLVAFAGCADGGTVATPPNEPVFEELDLKATSDRGIIRGVVVDAAIRPLAGVEVSLPLASGPRVVTTTASGVFGFDDLEPGTYFLTASKTGYTAIQQSAEVVAGVTEPRSVRILLDRIPGTDPFFSVRVWDGFVLCTTSFLVLCGAPNLLTGDQITPDKYTWTWFYEPNASLIQNEMVWDTSQPLTPSMYFEMEPSGDCDDGFFNRTEGLSPIYATLNQSQVKDGPIDDDCGVYFSLFSGHNEPLPRQPVTGWGIGATLQQSFRMFGHDFHHFLPEAGWRFTSHGEPKVPS